MNGFLLDTNIPSEMTRPSPQQSVSQWLDDADDEELYFSVVSLGEIVKGVSLLPESKRRSELSSGSMRLCGRGLTAGSCRSANRLPNSGACCPDNVSCKEEHSQWPMVSSPRRLWSTI
jgi:hypothetical protein